MVAKKNEKLKKITIYGLIPTIDYHKVKCCAEDLNKKRPEVFAPPELNGMLEFEWSTWLNTKKLELKGDVWDFKDVAMTFLDDQLIGDSKVFLKWAADNYNYEDCRNVSLYETLRKEGYSSYISSTKNTFVYFDFKNDGQNIGRLVIELFQNILPKTCENFRLLCTGEKGRAASTSTKLWYKGSILHRIIPQGLIQGGDIVSGKGNGSESVYGGLFEDESFAIPHDKRGVLGMSNTGNRNTNGSQYYFTLQAMPFMDKKCIAFGQIVEGSETLNKLEAINCQNQRPLKEIVVDDCGLYKFDF